MKKIKKLIPSCTLAFIGLVMLTGCPGASGNRLTLEYIPEMMDQESIKAQELPMRAPVEGTIPRGYVPYPFTKEEAELAGTALKNPLPPLKPIMLKGKEIFNTYCSVCHGATGKGNGPIVPKFPMPPSLHSDKVKNWPDGRLFHVMTRGQNLMPSYAVQMTPAERWAVVYYIRALQRAVSPTEADVEAYKKTLSN